MKKQWNRKKQFVGCYAPWLKDVIFAVTNIGAEILMYTQIYVLVKAAFFLEGIQRSSLIIKKKNKKSKTSILTELTKNLVTLQVAYRLGTKLKKVKCKRSHWHNSSPSAFIFMRLHFDRPPLHPKCERNNWMPLNIIPAMFTQKLSRKMF